MKKNNIIAAIIYIISMALLGIGTKQYVTDNYWGIIPLCIGVFGFGLAFALAFKGVRYDK